MLNPEDQTMEAIKGLLLPIVVSGKKLYARDFRILLTEIRKELRRFHAAQLIKDDGK